MTSIYWFRNDLRLHDNPALAEACATADRLVLVHVVAAQEAKATRWGFPRCGAHRQTFRDQALQGLEAEVALRGGRLDIAVGDPAEVIPALARACGADRLFCEAIAAPEELAELAALRHAGLEVHDRWQSTLLDPELLPFPIGKLPSVFTAFRHAVEAAAMTPHPPRAAPSILPPSVECIVSARWHAGTPVTPSGPASFPFQQAEFHGSESAALAHLERYFGSTTPQTYKETRNGLIGAAYSTKLSPWLAIGALSPRTVFEYLKAHEARFGANDSTYWIWFELLWRDYFRFWSIKHGERLFHARGLSSAPTPPHHAENFARWCGGTTDHAFIDAGMRELAASGYLSNRMRQVVASFLIHDLACDWRAGAAWFESRLIDYDVCSNQGNWLYLAGRGADPRQGRRFNPDKQAADYDRSGEYRALWSGPRPTSVSIVSAR